MKEIIHTIASKSLIALGVSAVLGVFGLLGTYTLGLWDGLKQPWTAVATIDTRLDKLEVNTEAAISAAVQPIADDLMTLTDDVNFIVANTPPLKVVDWNTARYRQVGDCSLSECIVSVRGARTDYGDDCGRVTSAGAEIRIDDEDAIAMDYGADFMPVRLTKVPRSIRIPLVLPSVTTPGEHEFRTWAEYEGCKGPGEPKTRLSPWYPLIVTE